jgi:hypothetical protein
VLGTKTKKHILTLLDRPTIMPLLSLVALLVMYEPLYPEKYIDYVVTSGVKLDHWARDELYEKYALEFILKEGVTTALERSIQTMLEWAAENEPAPWNHYFNHIGLNKAVWNIRDGKD